MTAETVLIRLKTESEDRSPQGKIDQYNHWLNRASDTFREAVEFFSQMSEGPEKEHRRTQLLAISNVYREILAESHVSFPLTSRDRWLISFPITNLLHH